MLISLPIDFHIPKIVEAMRATNALVLTAPPGAGKTTRIPRALYQAGFADSGEILILEPRRLATRLAASRVAEEFGEKPGETVGYSIRFESVGGPRTRIRFLTEAILARRIVQDRNLSGISTVILDEFHERHLATDLALAFLKQLRDRNQDLKIIVMSATMDAGSVASFLEDATVLSVGESPFELAIDYEAKADDRPLQEKVAASVSKLLRSGIDGNILVFLPGASEIRRSADTLRPMAEHFRFSLSLLHGDLPTSEQKQAIEPSDQIKVILATNVAETSITIPGVAAVIDSGLARVAGYSPWSGFPTLTTARISKSSANQRAGRAGRTRAGRVLRLYTRHDFESRPEHETPEIRRTDLSEAVLLLHGAGVDHPSSFPWFDPPADASLEASEVLLSRLGAVDANGRITGVGVRMLRLPTHPRLSRLIVEGEKLQIAEESTLLAALLSERDIRLGARTNLAESSPISRRHISGPSDLLELVDCFREAENAHFRQELVRALGLDIRAVEAVRRSQRQLQRLLSAKNSNPGALTPSQTEEALLISVLAAFPDRVAKRRKAAARELVLAGGGSALLSSTSIVHDALFVVAVDAEERRDNRPGRIVDPMIRLASAIEVEWIAGLFPESIFQKVELIWNERAGRVEEIRRTSYGQIALEEIVHTAAPSEKVSKLLAAAVFDRALSPIVDRDLLPDFRARLELVAKYFPQENLHSIGELEMRSAVELLCRGKRSLEELTGQSIVDALLEGLDGRQRSLIKREAPERIKLKAGRTVRVHYDSTKPPWIESRLQDFFGTQATPSLCGGQAPLTIHLLAPNGRAVQVTTDLAGFWERHYPAIRRELQRRYPKHAWPEPESLRKSRR
jgi:ATP-dependent helicase HrpB